MVCLYCHLYQQLIEIDLSKLRVSFSVSMQTSHIKARERERERNKQHRPISNLKGMHRTLKIVNKFQRFI